MDASFIQHFINKSPNSRFENQEHYIHNFFKNIYIEESPVLIWQKIISRRIIKIGFISNLEDQNDMIKLTIAQDLNETEQNFKGGFPFNFKSAHNDLLFKATDVALVSNHLYLKIPSMVQVAENRGEIRQHFGVESTHHMRVSVMDNFDKTTKNVKAIVYDISQNGASILISNYERNYFYKGDEVQIDLGQNRKLSAKVVYAKPYKSEYFHQNRFSYEKIGLKFVGQKRSLQDTLFY